MLEVSDPGAGFPEAVGFTSGHSSGLFIISILVKQLGGTIEHGMEQDRFVVRVAFEA